MGDELELRLQPIFNHAVDLMGAQRSEYLDRELLDDGVARRRVEQGIEQFETHFARLEDVPFAQAVEQLHDAGVDSLPRMRILDLLEARDRLQHIIPRAPEPTPSVPKQLGRYAIEKELGRGGMGEVYLAFDRELQRHVAIKFLPKEFAQDPERLALFEREARTAASLNHPNVATVHELGAHGGERFIVMEYVRGCPLSELIDEGPLGAERLLDFGLQITRGLEAAHEHAIVHRDLKPVNVMVTEETRLKILDFGLAKALQAPLVETSPERPRPRAQRLSESDSNTRTGVFLGTPGYSSPEQTRGATVDARTDLFSLGVVLYEMATGASPFRRSTSPADAIEAVQNYEPPPASEKNQNVPADLDAIIQRLIAKSPTERYATSSQVREDLEELHRKLTAPRTYAKAILVMVPLVALLVFAITWSLREPRSVIAFEEGLGKLEEYNGEGKIDDAKRQWKLLEDELEEKRDDHPELERFRKRLEIERGELRSAIESEIADELLRLKGAVNERDPTKANEIYEGMRELVEGSPPGDTGARNVGRAGAYYADLLTLMGLEDATRQRVLTLGDHQEYRGTLRRIERLADEEFETENFDLVPRTVQELRGELRDAMVSPSLAVPATIDKLTELHDTLRQLDDGHPRLTRLRHRELEARFARAREAGWSAARPELAAMTRVDPSHPRTRELESWITTKEREHLFDGEARRAFADREPDRLKAIVDGAGISFPSESTLLEEWGRARKWLDRLRDSAPRAAAREALRDLRVLSTEVEDLAPALREDAMRHVSWARETLEPRAVARASEQLRLAIRDRDVERARGLLPGADEDLGDGLAPWASRFAVLEADEQLRERIAAAMLDLVRHLNGELPEDETAGRRVWEEIAANLRQRLTHLAELDGAKSRLEEARARLLLGDSEVAMAAASKALQGELQSGEIFEARLVWAMAGLHDPAEWVHAQEQIERALALDSSSALARYLAGYCLLRSPRLDEALRHLDAARAEYPHAGVLLAEHALDEGRHGDVVSMLDGATSGRLCIRQARIIFGSVPEALSHSGRIAYSCQSLVTRARAELEQGHYSEAGEALQAALRKVPPAESLVAIDEVIEAAHARFLDGVSRLDARTARSWHGRRPSGSTTSCSGRCGRRKPGVSPKLSKTGVRITTSTWNAHGFGGVSRTSPARSTTPRRR